ncbi:hypothetical protein [Agromyces humatus]|uniref:HNH endonuclease n=1 Tax=Agromyces humatus TaxID=279573 RepID=A0ABP4X3Y9_9MICO|nr:hypothetical protein [Agromyces humatus]
MSLFTTTKPAAGLPTGYDDERSVYFVPEAAREHYAAVYPAVAEAHTALSRGDAFAGMNSRAFARQVVNRRYSGEHRPTDLAPHVIDARIEADVESLKWEILNDYEGVFAHRAAVAAALAESTAVRERARAAAAHEKHHTCPECGTVALTRETGLPVKTRALYFEEAEDRAPYPTKALRSCAICFEQVRAAYIAQQAETKLADGRTRAEAARDTLRRLFA